MSGIVDKTVEALLDKHHICRCSKHMDLRTMVHIEDVEEILNKHLSGVVEERDAYFEIILQMLKLVPKKELRRLHDQIAPFPEFNAPASQKTFDTAISKIKGE